MSFLLKIIGVLFHIENDLNICKVKIIVSSSVDNIINTKCRWFNKIYT